MYGFALSGSLRITAASVWNKDIHFYYNYNSLLKVLTVMEEITQGS